MFFDFDFMMVKKLQLHRTIEVANFIMAFADAMRSISRHFTIAEPFKS